MLGNESGVLVWGLGAAFGLFALLVASQIAYDMIRPAGVGVLVWSRMRALWQLRRRVPEAGGGEPVPAGSIGRFFRLGVVTNLANPKAGVFAVSLPAQLVPAGAPVLASLVQLSVLWALIDADRHGVVSGWCGIW